MSKISRPLPALNT